MRKSAIYRILLLASPIRSFAFLCMLAIGFSLMCNAFGQSLNPEIRIVVQEDGNSVYIYHTALPAINHGFNVYRKLEDDAEFQKINLDPIRGVISGTELRAYLGTLYDDIEQITDQSTENETLTKVRSDIRTANLLTFTYPKVAEALGRLYIDTQAPMNQLVTYKLEFVDALDQPTGSVLEKKEILLPQRPLPPTYLRAENQDKRITLFWQYPVLNENKDDKVVQFLIYRIDPSTNQHELINDNKVILKNDAIFEYAYSFNVASTGKIERFYVKAVDISGQQSDSSEILHYETLDTIPPDAVINVETQLLPGNRIQITWEASKDPDISGYNLYRSTSLSDKDSYIKLNQQLFSKFEKVYNDTLVSGISNELFYYRVTALDAQGNEGPFSTAAIALLQDETPPSAPSDLLATYNSGGIELAWSQSDLPEDFESFIVLRHIVDPDAPLVPSRVNHGLLTDTSITDPGIANAGFVEGATYRYEVIGIDKAGNQSKSSLVEIKVPDISPPAPPNGLQVMIDNSSRIVLFWNPSPSTDIMSYLVYRREIGSTRIYITPLLTQRLRYLDTSIEPGIAYEYWVTAADHSGNESLPSEPATIHMKDDTAPRSVRNVQVEHSSGSEAVIRWEPVPSADLAGYKVFRSTTMTGNYEPLFEEAIYSTQWIDPNADPSAWYMVFAIDTSGNMSPPSSPTRVITPLSSNN